MESNRRAVLLAQLAFIDHLGRGNIVVDRWREACVAELAALDAGKGEAA